MPPLDGYLAALNLTHQMTDAAKQQDWSALSALEAERSRIIASMANKALNVSGADKDRISGIIFAIEQESKGIVELVENWQNDVRILLQLESHSA